MLDLCQHLLDQAQDQYLNAHDQYSHISAEDIIIPKT